MTTYRREFLDRDLQPVPVVTGTQMAEIDRLMMERVGVNTYQLMELAGFAVAEAVRRFYGDKARRILFLAGSGGNGGDAMVAARLLAGWGYECVVITTRGIDELKGIVAHQAAALLALDIPVHSSSDYADHLPESDLIVDGLLGFSLQGNPHGEAARLINLVNAADTPVLAFDIPSGLNADDGRMGNPTIRARHTVTLALPKIGLTLVDPTVTGTVLPISVCHQGSIKL